MSNIIHLSADYSLKKQAFKYQVDAYNAIKDLDYAAIFHEQGLGKTKIAIDLLIYWLERRNIDSVIIVTKKQLVNNWVKEFGMHTHLKTKVLDSNKRNNYYILNSLCKILITNFETISSEKNRLKLYCKTRNVAIILDESTKIKNPDSQLTKNFFELSDFFKIKLIMTGTPVANRPYDIWAQIYFLDKGKSLGDDFSSFMHENNLSNDLSTDIDKRKEFEKSVSSIFNKISSFTVRETKDSGIIKLPNKNIVNVFCDFELNQKIMYETLKKEFNVLIQKGDDSILDESNDSLKRLLRFLQITSNPRLIDDLYGYESGKESKLSELLNLIISERNEKVIVWSSFIENVNYFSKKYSKYGSVKIHGSMSIEDRNKSVEKFLNSREHMVLFATPQSAKEGLTLTVANNVIFYDRGFNLDDYLQSQDRIHRISQLKECNIYNIMIKDSIDEWIDSLLQAKQSAAHLAQGDFKLAKFCTIMNYDYGDLIKDLLGLKGGKTDEE